MGFDCSPWICSGLRVFLMSGGFPSQSSSLLVSCRLGAVKGKLSRNVCRVQNWEAMRHIQGKADMVIFAVTLKAEDTVRVTKSRWAGLLLQKMDPFHLLAFLTHFLTTDLTQPWRIGWFLHSTKTHFDIQWRYSGNYYMPLHAEIISV